MFKLADRTVNAWLLHTRVYFSLQKSRSFSLWVEGFGLEVEVKFDSLAEPADKVLVQFAKLVRKLKYIEEVFNEDLLAS